MFKFPYTNLHELNLDWILEKVKALVANNDEFNDKADYAVETADEAKTIAEQAAQAQIGDGAVTTQKLADDAVTSAKLADNSVYSVNIVDGEVGTSDLAEGAVTTSRIHDGAVTGAKILDGSISNAKLGNASVTNPKIEDGAVTLIKLASEAKSSSGTNYIKTPDGTLIVWGVVSFTSADYAKTVHPTDFLPSGLSFASGTTPVCIASPNVIETTVSTVMNTYDSFSLARRPLSACDVSFIMIGKWST